MTATATIRAVAGKRYSLAKEQCGRLVEPVRIGKLAGVAVGRTDAQMHVGVGRNPFAADLGAAGRAPIAELVGALHAQELFHGASDKLRMSCEVMPGIRML